MKFNVDSKARGKSGLPSIIGALWNSKGVSYSRSLGMWHVKESNETKVIAIEEVLWIYSSFATR